MQKNNKNIPYLIGITGSFGMGKSFVGDLLKEASITVIDTDEIVKNILKTENNITKQIIKEFGKSIINKENEYINRKSLADMIFTNEIKRKKLESILHPEVNKEISSLILRNKDRKIFAVLIPLLFECNLENDYNEIWCVYCKSKVQYKRLIKKGFTKEEITARTNSQLPIEEKMKKSNFVIDNSESRDKTKNQVILRLKELVQLDHNLHLFFDK